jgi:hypothetical protein
VLSSFSIYGSSILLMTHDKKTKEFLLVVLKIFYDKEYLLVQEFIVLCSSFTITDTSFKPFLAAARQLQKIC